MADEEDIVITSAATITAVVAARKIRKRHLWVRLCYQYCL